MKKCSKKILLGGMAALLVSMFISCSDGPNGPKKPDPVPNEDGLINPYAGDNKTGTISENLIEDGDADESDDGFLGIKDDGATHTRVDGGRTGKAWKVMQTRKEWSEICIDMTSVYGQGKSYLVTAWVKNDPENTTYKNAEFEASWTLYSGDVKNWADKIPGTEHYDYDDPDETNVNEKGEKIVGPWGGELDVEGTDFDGFTEDDFNVVEELSDDWQMIQFIIPSTAIEEKVNNSGVYEFLIAFCAGPKGAAGYSYLIDDISVKDLNSELKKNGRTWKDPNPKIDDDESEDDEEESEE